ncbi:MAG TPA: DUF2461 domain-containing protein [Vicinamibacterales bacterium]|jgi:uncharacterized protein (TIGR02453 family)
MFTKKTLSFLRALKRNNRREWFLPRKDDYEQHVKAPMIALVERLAGDMRTFAPELVADPKVSLFRVYRDTRFSSDKTPYKTHVAARFPRRGFPRGEGAGLYMEIAPGWVWMGGGMYMPTTADLHDIRAQIASSHPRFHRLVTAPAFTRTVGALTGERLTRVPLGYTKDHPAAHYLQFKQFLGACEYEASLATSPRFYRALLNVFKGVAPLVQFLNAALEPRLMQTSPPADEARPRDRRPAAAPRQVPEPMW